ncbi:MAG: hypothetical protein R8G66_07570 [Cytophagales bacterium]|nr:hypothetical protein [Cytophagales bacterium]
MLLSNVYGQVDWKRKAEKKADQVVDKLLFGKKKKKNAEQNQEVNQPNPDYSTSSQEETSNEDTFQPESVDFESIDMGNSIPFRTLINILPESTQGYQREGKPEGSTMKMQGVAYSMAQKSYSNGSKDLEITLYDYLGAESYAMAMTSGQYEYESTEGYSKSIVIDSMNGWITYDNSSKESNLMLFKDGRFWVMVSGENLDENALTNIAKDVDLGRLKAPE